MNATIGEIRLFAGNFAPRDWAFCDGQLLSVDADKALFEIIGSIYGGDGRTTFALPDLRGRCPVSVGVSLKSLGDAFGAENVAIRDLELPNHRHSAKIVSGTADLSTSSAGGTDGTPAAGNAISADSGKALLYGANALDVKMASASIRNISRKVIIEDTGGSQPHDNMQPSLALNYIICKYGIFPIGN